MRTAYASDMSALIVPASSHRTSWASGVGAAMPSHESHRKTRAKSRRYSTTFGLLRAARAAWQHRHTLAATAAMDPWERLAAAATHHIEARWQMAGSGWRLAGDALLAATERRHAQHARDAAREQRPALELARALAA